MSSESQAVIRVLAAVICRGGRFLVCRRPPEKRHGGLWEFPGGKLEPGENHLAAARRELVEELSLTVTNCGGTLHSVADPQSPYIVDFVAVEAEGKPQLHEHQELLWTTAEALTSLALAPSDKRFVQERKAVLKEIAARYMESERNE